MYTPHDGHLRGRNGFTIVELLIVIVIIGILASITIIAYNGITARARASSLMSDLVGAGKEIAMDYATNGSYPSSAAAANYGKGLTPSSGNTFQYGTTSTGYCLTAVNGSLTYYISDASTQPAVGTCGGLMASYYGNKTLTAPVIIQRLETGINYNWGGSSPAPGVAGTNFSVEWDGYVTATTAGSYTFTATSDDGERLYVNGSLLIDKWVDEGPTAWTGTISLTAGQKVPIVYQMYQNGGGAVAKLEWTPPGGSQVLIPSSALSPN